jgi:serine phosphatase RsbU (regulator of sigma subunit)/HAMP domain-containing protein
MINVTYFYTLREIKAKRRATQEHIRMISKNIATIQLIDRQEWDIYQNYIAQLMIYNPDIIYIAVFDARKKLRAHTLNTKLLELNGRSLTRRQEIDVILQLEQGAVSQENKDDIQTEIVDIRLGDRILGSVHVGFSIIHINRELQYGIYLNILFGALFIILSAFAAAFFSKRLTKPLEMLSGAMKKVNEGEPEPLTPQSGDEVGMLTVSFNEMIRGLNERKIIENLAKDISAAFNIKNLVPLIRNHLKSAAGAERVKLFLKERGDKNIYKEPQINERGNDISLKITPQCESFLKRFSAGFMINHAPDYVKQCFNYDSSKPNGLVLAMILKEKIFGILFFELKKDAKEFHHKEIRFASFLSNQATIALENALIYEDLKEQERIKHEFEIARKMQEKLLPAEMPNIPSIQLDAVCMPAQELGGDYFDFFAIDDSHLGIAIADVCGKGVSAAFLMAEIKGMMMQLTKNYFTPKKLMIELNRMLYRSIDRNSFVTMIYAVLDIPDKTVTFSRAGHNPAIKCGMDGKAEFLTPSGIGLGIDSGPLFEKNITEQSVSLNAGDIFLLYTDGIVEAMNHADEMFGEDYLLEILQRNHNRSAGAVKNEILTDLEEFLNGRMLQDDTTMVILKNSGNS